jgi:uncharacterized protein YdaU (DUF1376 family)
MSRADTWMPLYIGDYLADTMALEAREHGAYLLLIMHYWRNGPLPDDDRALAGIARVDRATWMEDTGTIVRGFFQAIDGRLHHKRIDRERASAQANTDTKRAAAHARWDRVNKQKGSTSNAYADAPDDAHGCTSNAYASVVHVGCISPSPSPKEEKKEDLRSSKEARVDAVAKKADPNGTRLPDDWNPGVEGEKFARDLGIDPSRTFERFQDYWRGVAGAKGRKADWLGTWRNWCRKEAEDRGTLPLAPAGPTRSNPGGHTFTPMTGGF